jgi:hypothetical protein
MRAPTTVGTKKQSQVRFGKDEPTLVPAETKSGFMVRYKILEIIAV